MMDIEKEISCKIKEIRIMRGFSQSQLARYMGVTQGYVSAIESGEYAVGLKVLKNIAEILKFEIKIVPKKLNDGSY